MDVINPLNRRNHQNLNSTHKVEPSLDGKPVVQLCSRDYALPPSVTEQLIQDPRDARSLKNRCHAPQAHEYPPMPEVRG